MVKLLIDIHKRLSYNNPNQKGVVKMYKLIKNIKYRLVIGATIGTMAGGAFGIGINNTFKVDGTTPTYPFVREDIDTYGVTTQKYYIDKIKKGTNTVYTFPTTKVYIDSIEKKNQTEENNKSIKSIELTLYYLYNDPTNDKKTNYKKPTVIKEQHYLYLENRLTKEWLEEIINLYKLGELEYLTSIAYYVDYYNDRNIEEIENDLYISAELTIETVDYNDIQVIKQSKEENFLETFGIMTSTVFGTWIGTMLGSIWQYRSNMSEHEKELSKSKKLTKKK